MRTPQELALLKERAVTLRRQGKSRRQIKQILGPIRDSTLCDALRGEPPPEWTRRPNAMDDLRAKARELRARGMDYREIAAALGVSKSSVSLWVRDLPRVGRLSTAERKKRSAEGSRRYWAVRRQADETSRAAARAAAVAEIGNPTDRELIIAGAIAYWCEGSKNKLGPPDDRVVFTNSDPALVRFFLRFLEVTGTPRTDSIFRVCIHESADVESAQRFWLQVTGASPDQFRRPTLKRHNPKTVRKNVGECYHGCLRIDVRRSGGLYRRIEAWAAGIMTGSGRQDGPALNPLCAPGEGFEPSLTIPKTVVLPG
jgi:transcriptional regulator with XRE-family HTH domain